MLTIEGALDLASSGMAYLQPRNTPSALTAITVRHSENGVCSTSPGVPMPALLTRPSRRPCVRSISRHRRLPVLLLGDVERDVDLAARSQVAADGRAARRLDRLAHGRAQRAQRAGHEDDMILAEHSSHTLSALLLRWPSERPMPNVA